MKDILRPLKADSLVEVCISRFEERLLSSLLAIRELVETETTRLAAQNRTTEHLDELQAIAQAEEKASPRDLATVTRLDFSFHHAIGMASGNLIYPLLINSFKPVYMNFTSLFFSDPSMLPETVRFHRRLVQAIQDRDTQQAGSVMHETLMHGERHLRRILAEAQRR